MEERILFSTNSNPDIVQKLLKRNSFREGKAAVQRFVDQEISVLIQEDVEKKEVYVLGSSFPPTENLLELIILINTLKENGAKKTHVLLPYWGYAKADSIKPKGATLSAKIIAETLELAGADTIAVINIHSQLAQNFFKIPFTYLDAIPLLANGFDDINSEELTIVSPDKGGVKRAEEFASVLGAKEIAYVDKKRPEFDKAEIRSIKGNIKNKICVIVDDMAQSGGTLLENAKVLKEQGAKNVFIAVTHIVHTGGSIPKLEKDKNIDKVIFTNTIPYAGQLSEKLKMIDVSELFVKLMEKI